MSRKLQQTQNDYGEILGVILVMRYVINHTISLFIEIFSLCLISFYFLVKASFHCFLCSTPTLDRQKLKDSWEWSWKKVKETLLCVATDKVKDFERKFRSLIKYIKTWKLIVNKVSFLIFQVVMIESLSMLSSPFFPLTRTLQTLVSFPFSLTSIILENYI